MELGLNPEGLIAFCKEKRKAKKDQKKVNPEGDEDRPDDSAVVVKQKFDQYVE